MWQSCNDKKLFNQQLLTCHLLKKDNMQIKLVEFKPEIAEKLTLKGHKKLEAYWKLGPTVKISWIKSSTQMIPDLPNLSSII